MATSRRLRVADRSTDLFGSFEFIAPDVIFKTANAGQRKNRLFRKRQVAHAAGRTF